MVAGYQTNEKGTSLTKYRNDAGQLQFFFFFLIKQFQENRTTVSGYTIK